MKVIRGGYEFRHESTGTRAQVLDLLAKTIEDETPKTSANIVLFYNRIGLRYSELRIKHPLRMASFEVDFPIRDPNIQQTTVKCQKHSLPNLLFQQQILSCFTTVLFYNSTESAQILLIINHEALPTIGIFSLKLCLFLTPIK